MVSWPGPAGIFSPGWSEPPTLRRHEVRFGFTIVLDESGVHDHGVSIKRAPSVFDVRLPIDFVCSTSMSRPFLRVLQTAGFDRTRTITPIKSVDWNLENPSKILVKFTSFGLAARPPRLPTIRSGSRSAVPRLRPRRRRPSFPCKRNRSRCLTVLRSRTAAATTVAGRRLAAAGLARRTAPA